MKVATHLDRRSAPEGAGLRTVAGATGARLPCPLPMAGARHACSPAQRRFWVMDRIEPGTPALNLAIAWRVDAGLTGAMLGRAVAMLIERHPALRTSFAEEDGEPVQVVERSLTIQVPEIDLGGLAQEDALAEAARIARQQAQTPFDLSAAPLIRVTRIRLREPACVVLLTAHLLVCDRESLQVLGRELGTICRALIRGGVPDLPRTPPGYRGPAARPAQRRPDAALHRDDQFWMKQLQGLEYFELHPDRARPAVQTSSGSIESIALERELIEGLRDLAQRCGCSLLVTVLGALYALLHRYSGETDIAIGSQDAGRDEAGLENAVGLYINTLVLRADLSGDPAFADLLARVGKTVTGSSRHRATPLDRVIELVKPRRDLSRHALFSVNFVFQTSSAGSGDDASLRLVEMPPCSCGAMSDLNFLVVEQPGGWRASCEYNSDLFESATIVRLLGHFANLLRAAVANPGLALSALPMLGGAEQHALAVERNQTAADYPKQAMVTGVLEGQAQRTPDSVAVVCGAQVLSYRELDRASNRLAHELLSRGISRGSLVGICLGRTPDLVVALLAVLKSGAAYVPLDPAYPVARLAQIVEDARPAAVLTTEALRARLPGSDADEQVTAMILLDVVAPAIARQPHTPCERTDASAGRPEDLAYVIFTSGSTGRPKGVQIQHQALTNLLWAMLDQPGLSAQDTLVSVTTVSFDIAALEIFLPLIVGAKLVIAQEDDTADGEALLRLLRLHRATVMQATPVTWQILLAAGWRADPPLKMLCGGEALSRTLADQLLMQGGELWNMYGPTETTIWSSALRVTPGAGPVSIGPPIANTQFHVLDVHGALAATGAAGELCIGGDGVALGYLNRAELTAERFVPDPFRGVSDMKMYRTGDRVRRRPGGELEFLGRFDHQIKLRGFRIELGEIESVLRAHPQVADCVAVAVTGAAGECEIRAYVVAQRPAAAPQATVDSAALVAELQASLQQALPAYMCPGVLAVLEALPRTPNGKLDRAALPAGAPLHDPQEAQGRPFNDVELRLARLWSVTLGAGDGRGMTADANFFEIGGHSLLAVRLLARIHTEFAQKISLAALFKNPTIAGQAQLLAQMAGDSDPRAFDFRQVVKLQPNGSRPPLIAINNTGIYYALSRRLGLDRPFTSLQLFDPSLPGAVLPRTLEEIAAGYAQLIRRVQHKGPYALLGWCVAGTLAFEVARQLTAAGEDVSQLILFDTLAPGHLTRLPWPRSVLADYAYRWQLITADWTRVRRGTRTLPEFLGNRTIVRKLTRGFGRAPLDDTDVASAKAVQGWPLRPEQYDQWLLRYLEDAAAAYEPKPYRGTMTLFRSSTEPAGLFLDPQMGWGRFVTGGLDVVVIDGDHFSIFQEPSVSAMAQHIESGLRSSDFSAPAGRERGTQ